ncbi:MAG: glycosyltransferase family 4 protein [Blastocatellales bacterium]
MPVVRRLRDWQTYFSDRHFDRYVAANLTRAEIFQGVTGQCLESMSAAKRMGSRTALDVVTLHIAEFGAGQDRECAKFGLRPTVHPWTRKRILREYDQADVIRVMSERARRSFLERGFDPQRVVTVPPPIDFDQFPAAEFRESKFRVSFVGLIEPWKGFHYLIEAFNKLRLRDSELVLWGGPGARSISQYLRNQTAANPAILVKPVEVRSLGYGEVYGKSSVLVHPSLADGFGYVVAEAMASGIPVIVTDKTGASDLVVDGQNGYVVPAGDSQAISDRLAHLAGNPSLLKRMGQAARETARQLTMENFRARQRVYLNV